MATKSGLGGGNGFWEGAVGYQALTEGGLEGGEKNGRRGINSALYLGSSPTTVLTKLIMLWEQAYR
jgi:hypothetical protein